MQETVAAVLQVCGLICGILAGLTVSLGLGLAVACVGLVVFGVAVERG